jgi:hypothetical protein
VRILLCCHANVCLVLLGAVLRYSLDRCCSEVSILWDTRFYNVTSHPVDTHEYLAKKLTQGHVMTSSQVYAHQCMVLGKPKVAVDPCNASGRASGFKTRTLGGSRQPLMRAFRPFLCSCVSQLWLVQHPGCLPVCPEERSFGPAGGWHKEHHVDYTPTCGPA